MKAVLKLAVLGLLLPAAALPLAAQQDYFSNWPAGRSPQEVGKALAEHFVTSPHQHNPGTIFYGEVGTWYGALNFAELTHDTDLRDRLIKKFDPLMPGGAEGGAGPQARSRRRLHLRHRAPGNLHPDQRQEVSRLRAHLRRPAMGAIPMPDGLSHETRYWIDDMYMLTILQLQAYRATGDKKYLDRDAHEMVAYLDKLQQPNGLFYHAPDVPFFWGRGDGWVAAGMAEMLRTLPADHPQRARIMAGYKLMMAALLKYQGADGMWRQLIDHDEAWEESSSSGMFTFALITGVKNGWLDAATYGPAARKGWIAVTGFIDQNNDVTNICAGTNKFNSLDYYLERPRRTGDFHGQEPILWAASELLR